MKDWDNITDKIIMAVAGIETETIEEETLKTTILMYLYKSLESPETFESNIEALNEKNRVR